jgi:hypothetical protein
VVCNGESNGAATVTVSGGNAPYAYAWDKSASTSASASDLVAGLHTITITDSKGCETTALVTIAEPALALSCAAEETKGVTYKGGNDGEATVAPVGGWGQYTYEWNNGQTSAVATGLAAGVYSVIVRDAEGCQTTCEVTVTEPGTGLSCSAAETKKVTCIAGANGEATVTPVGGWGQYTYLWSDGQTTATATALVAGGYSVIVTDAKGGATTCEVIVTEPEAIYGIDIQTACDSFTWIDGETYTTSNNSARWTLTNANGCDSTVTLNLTIIKSTSSVEEVTACDSFEWNGNIYKQSGAYSATFKNAAGCDSIANLILTITTSSDEIIQRTACDQYMMNGITYTESGTYIQNLQNREGCDLTLTIELTIVKNSSSQSKITACGPYTWNGKTYDESGTYTLRGFTNAAGCDSTATLILTINQSTESTEEVATCNSFNWNGIEYTESGSYSAKFANAAGCDSIANLILTINNGTSSTEEVATCGSYNWNGKEYTESGSYSAKFTNAAGCDSIANLILTINNGTSGTEEVATCGSYNWNGKEYTESGSYSAKFTNAAGCDSIANLILTINNGTSSTEEVATCGSYNWNGKEYTESGSYSAKFTNAAGCDSIANLVLTINNSKESFETVSNCNSYIWNGIEYTQSGSYSSLFTTVEGCDSTVHLLLTILDSTTATINEIACDKITINDVTYTESGVYTQKFINVAGCDSILTINLTITPCLEQMLLVDDNDTTTLNTAVIVDVKANDKNIPDGSIITVPAKTSNGGTIKVNTDGSVTYTPATDYIGEDSFVYTVTTPDELIGSATVTILITPPANMVIDAIDDEFEIFNDGTAQGSIISNDINTVGDIVIDTEPVKMPVNGTVSINTDGTFVYTPNVDFSGTDSFGYRICNSIVTTMCDEAVVTIYVLDTDTIQPPFLTTCDSLFIPNGFSPNNDNINDFFVITLICQSSDGSLSEGEFYTEYPEAKVEIYNRWGNLVFEKEKYGNIQTWGNTAAWWDGRSTSGWNVGNDMLPPGTYFYILNFNNGTKEPKAGSIFLNR